MTGRLLASLLCLVVTTSAAPAQWFVFNPAGYVNDQGITRDLESRCTAAERRNASDKDRVTYAHELTHQLNGHISETNGGHALYTDRGFVIIVPEPRLSLAQVHNLVRQDRQSTAYYNQVHRGYWANRPLIVLDEWTAYANGSIAASEFGCDPHGSRDFAVEGGYYADALIEAIRRYDPQYQYLDNIVAFVNWHKRRVAWITTH
jgi:hypothetical protein